MITVPADTVLYAGALDTKEDARSYIAQYGLTKSDIKLVERGDVLCVVARKEIVLGQRD